MRSYIFHNNQYVEMSNEQNLLEFTKLQYKIVTIHEVISMNSIILHNIFQE